MLGNWFSFDRPGGRLLTATFGAIFLLLGLANLTTVSVGSLVAAIPLEIVFIGGGGWLILSALSGVRVVQGVSVGGGAMLLRVALEAGESVLTYGVAGYEQVDKSQRKVPASARLTGECFVTDRRVIITPQRMMSIMGWRARWTSEGAMS